MKFYEIKLKSVPKIIFACAVSVDNYKNSFRHIENFLEISVNTGGDIYIEHFDGENEIFRSGMITSITQDVGCKTYARSGVHQSHVTVGVNVSYDCTLHDAENMDYSAIKSKVKNDCVILVPYLFELNEKYNDTVSLINKIICKNASVARQSSCEVLSDWFLLVGKLTDMVMKEIEGTDDTVSPYSLRYAELARQYISDNYTRKLSVNDVAANVGISAGYLQLIFKRHFGMSVTEYINYNKIQLAKQYVQCRALSLKDISFQLGIDDPSYMSRMFKKIAGISFREYCKTHEFGS